MSSPRDRKPGTARYKPLVSSRVGPALSMRSRSKLSTSRSGSALVASRRPMMSPLRTPSTPHLASSRRTSGRKARKPRPPVDLKVVRTMLQRLVEQRPAKDSDQFRHVFRLFGRPKNGVTWEIVQRQVHTRMGIILSDEEAQELFATFDKEGKGALSLPEVIKELMPPDYTRPTWNIVRDEEMTRVEKQKTKAALPYQATVPPSLKTQEWHLQDFIETLQRKIVERTKRPSDQFREAYIVFGKPEKGLTKTEFREMIFRLGIIVTDAQLDTIMDHFDTDRNGVLSFEELCRKVIQPDYTQKQWTEVRDDELAKTMAERGHKQAETTLKKWPEALKVAKPTLRQLKEQLAAKILERTKRANDQYREAFQLFGSPADGIQFKDFKHQLRGLGIVASSKALKALFKVLDVNKNGMLSFQELVQQVLPQDYTAETWVEKADRRGLEMQRQRESRFNPVLSSWPKSMEHARMTQHEIVRLIQKKIVERTKRPEDQYREAFKVFGSPHNGITEEELGESLSRLGMVLSKQELHALFTRWDENGNGLLEFSEFVAKVMEPDYTEKSWYILADERALAKQQREREEWLATSPFVARKRPSSRTAMAVALDSDEQKKEAPAVPALSYRSDATRFKEEDLDDLMTPLPKQVLEAGMKALHSERRKERSKHRRHRRHRHHHRRHGKSAGEQTKKRGQGSISIPMNTSRAPLSRRPDVKPLALPQVSSR